MILHLILISFLLLEYYHCDLLLWFIDVRLTHLINITYLLISIISRLADVYFIVLLGIIYLHHTQYKHSVSRFICKSHINSINSRWDYRWLGKFRPHLTAIKRYAGSRSPGGLCQRDRLVFWYIIPRNSSSNGKQEARLLLTNRARRIWTICTVLNSNSGPGIYCIASRGKYSTIYEFRTSTWKAKVNCIEAVK